MPVLLMGNAGLVKTQRFEKPKYLGDPINTVKIFNDKEVDELVLLDILSTSRGRPIQFDVIQEIVSEAFVPVTYGGGVRSVSDVSRLLALGVEKISLNTAATDDPKLLGDIADRFGSSTLVVSIDAAKRRRRYEVMTSNGTRGTGRDPATFASEVQRLGAGEILINSVDRDGTMEGYDIELLAQVSSAVTVPIVACGGARSVEDFRLAVSKGGVSACAAGAMFVFQGRHRAVLISFPSQEELDRAFGVPA